MRGTALKAGLPRDAVRNVIEGHEPKLSRAEAVARALGISVQPAPAEEQRSQTMATIEECLRELNRAVIAAGGDPIPPESRNPRGAAAREPGRSPDGD